MGQAARVRLALDGRIALRDLTVDEAREFDAEVTVRIDEAVARADFASAPLPDLAPSPEVRRMLADLASRPPRQERDQ